MCVCEGVCVCVKVCVCVCACVHSSNTISSTVCQQLPCGSVFAALPRRAQRSRCLMTWRTKKSLIGTPCPCHDVSWLDAPRPCACASTHKPQQHAAQRKEGEGGAGEDFFWLFWCAFSFSVSLFVRCCLLCLLGLRRMCGADELWPCLLSVSAQAMFRGDAHRHTDTDIDTHTLCMKRSDLAQSKPGVQ